MKISIVIPIYNERQTIARLYSRLKEVLDATDYSYEIVAVDDGSTDGSLELLKSLHEKDDRVRIVQLVRNFGQHAALAAGFAVAAGDTVVTLDADLQIDPIYIPKFVAKIEQGCDFVGGIRRGAGDSFFKRRLPSRLVNYLIGKVTGKRLKDYGCPLNAMKSEIVRLLPEYGEMQRFFKPLAVRLASKIIELEVVYQPRAGGQSKYDLLSLVDIFFDFATNFSKRLFQRVALCGISLCGTAFLAGAVYLLMRFILGVIRQPLDRLQAVLLLCFIFGLQLVVLGVLGDFVIRIYRKIEGSPIYQIRKIW